MVTDVAGPCPIGRKEEDLEHSYWIGQQQLLPRYKQVQVITVDFRT